MKKPLIAFAVLFVFVFAGAAIAGIKRIENHVAIAKSPAFVLAVPDGITKKTKKSSESFQVNYIYTAGGATHKIDTEFFDTLAEAEALAESPVQVAYATTAPADGIFKSEFDKRDPKEGTMSALVEAAGIALFAGIVGTLVLLWQFPWFRRP